jgi:dolichol-phosphate mannosyltransferase
VNKKNAVIKKVVVIIPAYLESENLVPLCNSIKNELPGVSILIVDDSPNLDSVHAVRHAEIVGVSIINRKAKMGRGSAVLFGMREFSNKSFDYLIEMDADFSHDPTELVGLLNAASYNHSDLVIASRYLENSEIKD